MIRINQCPIRSHWQLWVNKVTVHLETQPSHQDVMSAVNVSANQHTHPRLTCVPFTGQQGCQRTDHSPSHTTGYFWGHLGTFPQIFLTPKAGSRSISICDRYDQNSLFFLKSNNVFWALNKVVSPFSRLASVRVTERWFVQQPAKYDFPNCYE